VTKLKGFSLTEMLVVLALITILVALLFPALGRARASANESSMANKLKQIGMGVMMYRSENEGDGKYGKASEMGLTMWLSQVPTLKKLYAGPHPCKDKYAGGIVEWPDNYESHEAGEPWQSYVTIYQDATPVASTTNCSSPDTSLTNVFHVKLGLAVQLDGALIKRVSSGDDSKVAWWKE
jgi:prepilin-type N-terminal cleavage/methylation domain-containing protein